MGIPITRQLTLSAPAARTAPPRPWVLAIPFLLTLGLGLWGIRREDSLWGDETATYDISTRSLGDMFDLFAKTESVHGFYYLLVHGVLDVFGDNLVTLRLPSVLAMAVAAATVAAIGNRLAGPRTGLLAGVLLPLAPAALHYMQEARSYALVTALVAVATWLLVRALDEERSALWVWYAVTSLFACLLHEFAVLSLAAHGTTLLLTRVPWTTVRRWLLAVAGVAAGLAPLVVVSVGQREQISWITTPRWQNLYDFPDLALLGILSAGVLIVTGGRHGRPVALWALALPLLLVPTGLLLLVTFTIEPLYVNRYVLSFVIGFALLGGAALDRLWTAAARVPATWLWRGAIVVVVGVLIAGQVPQWLAERRPGSRQDDDAAAARAVSDIAEPGDGVLFLPARRRSVTQVYPDAFRGLRDVALYRSPTSSDTLYGVELPTERIRSSLLTVDRVVVLADDPPRGEPNDALAQEVVKRETLATRFTECSTTRVTGVVITVYVRNGPC